MIAPLRVGSSRGRLHGSRGAARPDEWRSYVRTLAFGRWRRLPTALAVLSILGGAGILRAGEPAQAAGAPAAIAISQDSSSHAADTRDSLTAVVTDAAGAPVADGTLVSFHADGPPLGVLPGPPIVGMAANPVGVGYWLVGSDGSVFAYGGAGFFGSMGNLRISHPIVGLAPTSSGKGYWLADSAGDVFFFGDAVDFGTLSRVRIPAPIVAIVPTPDGKGYWLAGLDGSVYTFGDAGFFGQAKGPSLAAPIVGMASNPTGQGYWLAGLDGGVYNFGDARFLGQAKGPSLAAPIVGMAATPTGQGYRLAGLDG